MKIKLLLLSISGFFMLALNAQMSTSSIDSLVNLTLKTFDVPGIAVGVVKDGKVIHAKGYGFRSLDSKLPVDAETLFGIASNSKAFTALALGMMVDEGRLSWDDRVRDHLPEFKLYDAYVSENFTVRDLLTHRSGLGLGAGDLMFFPDGNNFTRREIIHNLRYLKPVSQFRTKYDYDNNLYIVAGEVLAKVSGLSWEEFIEQRIMKPLGFDRSRASWLRAKGNANIIDAHVPVDGIVKTIPHDWSETANAAGGIMSNIEDLSKWLIFQMDSGRYHNNKSLVSKKVLMETWTPQTIIPVMNRGSYNTNFAGYGLGWFVSDVAGKKQLQHSGGLLGTVTLTTFIPELHLGIIVLTNQQSGAAFNAITNTIKDSYLGIKGFDRVKAGRGGVDQREKEARAIVDAVWKTVDSSKRAKAIPSQKIYSGSYHDDWFGKVEIREEKDGLRFTSEKSPRLKGTMHFYTGNTWVVKWDDRSFDADAFASFVLDENGIAKGFTMRAFSPLTDFSFDFHDLDLKRIK